MSFLSRRLFSSLLHSRVSTDPKVLPSFLLWLSMRGADLRTCDVKPIVNCVADKSLATHDLEHHWGVFYNADKPCEVNDCLITIPYSLSLGVMKEDLEKVQVEGVSFSKDFLELMESLPKEWTELKLGLRLLSERCRVLEQTGKETVKDTFWPYIGALPLYVPGIPLFFSPQQLQDLCYAPLQAQIKWKILFLKKLATTINSKYPHLFFHKLVDVDSIAWAISATSSRAFGFGDNKRLLPLVDMLNHTDEPNVKVALKVDKKENLIKVIAQKKLKKGDELTTNYGPFSKDSYLLQYGFLPDNHSDTYKLAFDMNLFELVSEIIESPFTMNPWKEELIKKLNYGFSKVPYVIRPINEGGLDKRLLALARILYTPNEVIPDFVVEDELFFEKKRNDENDVEVLALEFLVKLLSYSVESSPMNLFDLKDDEKALSLTNSNSYLQLLDIKKLCIRYRVGKKRILLQNIENLLNSLEQLIDQNDQEIP